MNFRRSLPEIRWQSRLSPVLVYNPAISPQMPFSAGYIS
jgi:hypothetical protein